MRMRKRASVVCLLPLFLIAASGESGTQSSRTTAIVGATVIDGTGGPPLPDATIVVTDKRIAAVGPRSSVDVPEGALVVDASGQFITPGLIDTNVHLSVTFARSGPSKETAVKYWERNAELTLEAAQMQLKYGVTTVRDSYGALLPLKEVRDAIARGEVIGPRMLVAGNIVGWGGPFSVSFSLVREEGLSLWEEQINDAVTQGSGEELMEMYPEELREAISAYLDKGPDFIKFGGTSHWSPTFIGFSEKAQRILVEETHKRGRIAETHSTSPEGLRISIEAGVDLIQHPEVLAGREISDELVRQIREREIVCSMLVNRWGGQGYQEHLEARKAAEARLASEESVAQKPGLKRAVKREKTSAERRRERALLGLDTEMNRGNAKKLIEGGCIVTVGTDNAPVAAPEFSRTPTGLRSVYREPGYGTISAIENLVELGMSAEEAIVAGSRNGAIASKGLEDFGTLEVGKFADLLILDADPIADISNLRKLRWVMKEGQRIDPKTLPTNPILYER